ncbi:MAG: class II fructose-bisphosphate aldolase [Candidatus Paceibacterota bacterium]|jgi:fructose-bisphosphate aldolase class II
MQTLREIIKDAQLHNVAVGHFNISDLAALKGIFDAAYALKQPVIIGVSEGERDFIGIKQVVALIKSLREEFSIIDGSASGGNFPIFLNADHTHSFGKIKEAVEAGFDAVLFDAGKENIEENIRETKEVVNFVKEYNQKNNCDVLVEGELGYIGSGSVILDRIPEGVSVKKEDLTKPEDAKRFIEETGIDLLAPALGTLHGMFLDASDPNLDVERIKEIKSMIDIPMVLHGASGVSNEQLKLAVLAGVSIVHINTELRTAWKRGLDLALLSRPNEIVPYKILPEVVHEVEKVVSDKIKILSGV